MSTEAEVFLAHHGIKGMKWGVRRSRQFLDRLAGRTTKPRRGSDDYNTTQGLRNKKSRDLTNDELKAINARLQLERTYSDLSAKSKKDGMKHLTSLWKTTNTIYKQLNTPLGKELTSKGMAFLDIQKKE